MRRRDFVKTGALLGAVLPQMLDGAPAVIAKRSRPVVIASGNGHRYRAGGTETCVQRAFRLITEGVDALDAVLAGVQLNELDPGDTSVGFGGLPNGEGVVQLDASCMHGPTRRAGAVAALEGVRTPSLVAKAVMDNTDHILLVAEGAQRFARQMGFTIEDDLNSERSRELWLEWRRRTDPARWPDPATRSQAGYDAALAMAAEGLIDHDHLHGTINCDAIDTRGGVSGVTTTSGLAWKLPGRVGDSPILGAGLYVDNAVGAAGSTGRGEANLFSLTSFLIVESMRLGRAPKDAALAGLRRIVEQTPARLLDENGRPRFGIEFYALARDGRHAGVTMWNGQRQGTYAVCDEHGARHEPLEALHDGEPAWTR